MSDLSAIPAIGTERIAAAFDGHGRRAALMPYLMGGFPSIERSLEIANLYARYADVVDAVPARADATASAHSCPLRSSGALAGPRR